MDKKPPRTFDEAWRQRSNFQQFVKENFGLWRPDADYRAIRLENAARHARLFPLSHSPGPAPGNFLSEK